jgi:competence protein ComGC
MSGHSSFNSRSAFTLLEMILALMITSMTVVTLYRFVTAHLTTIRVSSEMGDERDTLQAAVRFVQTQMNALPPGDDDTISGQAFKFHGLSADEITWRCPAGSGVMTTAASGYFQVTMAVQPVEGKSAETELGLRRRPAPENTTSLDLHQGGAGGHYDWVSLARPMAAVEIRYFDAQAHSWADAWKDPHRRPTLVRVRLWRHAEDLPLEAVVSVPSARLAQ